MLWRIVEHWIDLLRQVGLVLQQPFCLKIFVLLACDQLTGQACQPGIVSELWFLAFRRERERQDIRSRTLYVMGTTNTAIGSILAADFETYLLLTLNVVVIVQLTPKKRESQWTISTPITPRSPVRMD